MFSETLSFYKDQAPKLDLRTYFSGPVNAWGLLKNWRGQVFRRFKVEMVGEWAGNEGTLEETFWFDDGEEQKRTWSVIYKSADTFSAQASDSIGLAHGQQMGFALNMRYTLAVPIKGKKLAIQLDDWMYLLDEKRLMNISTMKKFGIPLGKIFIYFEK